MSFPSRSLYSIIALIGIVAGVACAPRTSALPATRTPEPTPTATPTAAPTSTDCPTAWAWATGPGSPVFDEQLSLALKEAGLEVRLARSSAFGENNLCNGSFHAMSLDVVVELDVADVAAEGRLSELNATILQHIEETRAVSEIPNLGRVEVRFVAPDATWRCATAGGDTTCGLAP